MMATVATNESQGVHCEELSVQYQALWQRVYKGTVMDPIGFVPDSQPDTNGSDSTAGIDELRSHLMGDTYDDIIYDSQEDSGSIYSDDDMTDVQTPSLPTTSTGECILLRRDSGSSTDLTPLVRPTLIEDDMASNYFDNCLAKAYEVNCNREFTEGVSISQIRDAIFSRLWEELACTCCRGTCVQEQFVAWARGQLE